NAFGAAKIYAGVPFPGGTFAVSGSLEVAFIAGHLQMSAPRYGHTATLLANGRVLLAGGSNLSGTAFSSTDIFDPAIPMFSPGPGMTTPRVGHTATLLPNGQVLITGGLGLASAEVYDPATGAFTPTGSMTTARDGHTATRLNNGLVLIAGGNSQTAELY